MLLDVICPPGVRQGEILTVQRPGDGAEFELALPAGVSPGQTFEVEVPEGQSTDFAGIETELLAELNRARTHPELLAASIQERLKHYRGLDLFPPSRGGKVAVPSKEGVAAPRDAIAAMRSQPAVVPLRREDGEGLRLAAEDHLVDRGGSGTVGHTGADGSSSMDRAARYGHVVGKTGECLWFGRPGATARQMVEDLIVDDGVPTRGHRLCILDPAYTQIGVRVGEHKTFGAIAVIEFAASFEDDGALVRARRSAGPPKPPAHAAPEKIQTQWQLGQCPTCRQQIQGGAVMELKQAGLRFHKACFKCDGCSKGLVGVPYKLSTEGRPPPPLCMDCWYERHGEVCTACCERIKGGVLKVGGKPYHKECHVAKQPQATRTPVSAPRGGGAARGASGGSRGRGTGAVEGAAGRSGARQQCRSVCAARTAAMTLAMDYASLE